MKTRVDRAEEVGCALAALEMAAVRYADTLRAAPLNYYNVECATRHLSRAAAVFMARLRANEEKR